LGDFQLTTGQQASFALIDTSSYTDAGYRGPRIGCGTGHQAEFVSYREKTFDTALGPVTLSRAWYHCKECRHGFAPRDALMAAEARRGAGHVRQIVVLGDGAAWIRNLAGRHLTKATQIAGLYHAREHELARLLEFMLGDHRTEWLAARLADPGNGDIGAIAAAARAFPLTGVKADAWTRPWATSRTTRIGWRTRASAPSACSTGSGSAATQPRQEQPAPVSDNGTHSDHRGQPRLPASHLQTCPTPGVECYVTRKREDRTARMARNVGLGASVLPAAAHGWRKWPPLVRGRMSEPSS
jgi:hypothetical protein